MFKGPCNGNGYGQPHATTNYHRTHSGAEHVTKVAQRPAGHAGGAVLHHHVVVHKESFKEVDGANDRRRFDNYPMMKANNHHGGVSQSHHRYEAYEETYEESCEEETYAYGAGRHHGHGGGGRRCFEYETHEETYDEEEQQEEEEFVVGGGGCAQLRRGYRGA